MSDTDRDTATRDCLCGHPREVHSSIYYDGKTSELAANNSGECNLVINSGTRELCRCAFYCPAPQQVCCECGLWAPDASGFAFWRVDFVNNAYICRPCLQAILDARYESEEK